MTLLGLFAPVLRSKELQFKMVIYLWLHMLLFPVRREEL